MRRGCPAKQRRSGRLARPAVNMELHILAGSRTEAPLALDGTGRTSALKPVSAAGWETSQVSPLQWSHQIGEGTVCIVRNAALPFMMTGWLVTTRQEVKEQRTVKDLPSRIRLAICMKADFHCLHIHTHTHICVCVCVLLAMIWLPYHTHPP